VSLLPTGTVTFLFTDIEGSTRLWQSYPAEMQKALRRHDEILRNVIEANNGYVFKTVGDAFCAAFHTALEGLNAALQGQFALQRESWETPSPILVRMALHTGEAEERGNDYYGQTLNRVARLESIAYGGQVLVSLVTAELVRDSLPDRVTLKDLGVHRLKDLIRPESVYQLVHPDLRSDFPPPKSLDVHVHNLPIQPIPLIGREKELEIIRTMLADNSVRVLTLTGPGGIGKTRLALQAAAENIERFRHGVFFVDLSSVFNVERIMPVIGETLCIRESNTRSAFQNVVDYLKDKQVLLVIDNFEQLINGELQIVKLFNQCPLVKILMTSREPLHVRGERVFAIPPLTFPKVELQKLEKQVGIDKLTQYESVRLFIETALSVRQDFRINNSNAPAVAEICSRLDGIPLAIELAAARIKLLTPEAILDRLQNSLNLLSSGAHDLPERQRTLRATIGWSYEQLDETLKKTFRSLSVFRGNFTIDAAEFLLSRALDKGLDILDTLESLVDKSLVLRSTEAENEPEFHMLETIRDYGREKLKENNEIDSIMELYTDYYMNLAKEASENLDGRDQVVWLDKLGGNIENIRSTLGWFLKRNDCRSCLEMAGYLWKFWQVRGYLLQGSNFLKQILSLCRESKNEKPESSLLAVTLLGTGVLARHRGDYSESENYLKESLAIFECNNDLHGVAIVMHELGWTSYRANRFDEAFNYFLNCKIKAGDTGDVILTGKAKLGLGTTKWRQKRIKEAVTFLEDCIKIFTENENYRSLAQAIGNMAIIFAQGGDFERAEMYFREGASIYEKLKDRYNLKISYNNIAYMSFQKKDYTGANKYYGRLLSLSRKTGDIRMMATARVGLAEVFLELGYFDRAEEMAEEAVKDLRPSLEKLELGMAYRILGQVSIRRGEKEKARMLLEKSVVLLRKTGDEEELAAAMGLLQDIDTN